MYLVDCAGAIQSSDIHLIPHNTTPFALSQNELKTLPNGSFDKATHLLCLDLSYNLLSTIERHTFAGLTDLFFLDLSDNLLHGPAVFLQSLSSLWALNLGFHHLGYLYYPIKYIVEGIFELKSLEYLEITHEYTSNNEVTQLQNTSLTDLSILGVPWN